MYSDDPQFKEEKNLQRLRRIIQNPFEPLDIKGPFDQKKIVHEPKLDKEILFLLKKAIEQYQLGFLSPPIITIVGDTGTGKSHILNQLVRQSIVPDQAHAFFIPVEPEELLRHAQASSGIMNCLLQSFKTTLFYEKAPGFSPVRPIDIYAHLIFKKLLDKAKQFTEISYQDFLRFPKSWLSFSSKGKPYPSFLVEMLSQPKHELKTMFCEIQNKMDPLNFMELFRDIERLVDEYGPSEGSKAPRIKHQMKELLRLAFAKKEDVSAFIQREQPTTTTAFSLISQELGDWSDLASTLEFPLIFVFDQFEDLQIVGSETIEFLLRRFMLLLLDAVRYLESDGDTSRVPAFLLAITREEQIFQYRHIRDRFPLLPNHERFINLTALRNHFLRELKNALMLIRTYLSSFWHIHSFKEMDIEQDWPFTTALLHEMHRTMSIAEITPRQWLQTCRDAWNFLVVQMPSQSLEQRRNEWIQKIKLADPHAKTIEHTGTPPFEPADRTNTEPTPKQQPEPPKQETESSAKQPEPPHQQTKQQKESSEEQPNGSSTEPLPNPPYEPENPGVPSADPMERWEQLIQNKTFQRFVREKIYSTEIQTPELSLLYSKFISRLHEFNCAAIRGTPQVFQRQLYALSQTITTFATATNNVRIFVGCSKKSNRGGGFGGEWDQLKQNIISLKKRDLVQTDPAQIHEKALMFRTVEEEPPGDLTFEVIAHPLFLNGQITMDTLVVFATLFVTNELHGNVPEIQHHLTWQEIKPILEKNINERWGFFGTITARGL